MRKLIAFHRSLAMFLSDPAGHVAAAWTTIRGALNPGALANDTLLRDAVVVVDNMVEAVTFYCRAESKEPADEPKQTKIEGGE